jgi:hypothetical protein
MVLADLRSEPNFFHLRGYRALRGEILSSMTKNAGERMTTHIKDLIDLTEKVHGGSSRQISSVGVRWRSIQRTTRGAVRWSLCCRR